MISGDLSFDFPPSLRVKWTIPDFFNVETGFEYPVQSPDFPFADGRYCLLLFQNRDSDDIEIQLLNWIDPYPERAVLYEVHLKSTTEEIHMHRPIWDNQTFFFSRIDLERQRDLYVPDGTLTVLCSVRLRKPSSAGTPKSGGDQTRVILQHRMRSGELTSESPLFLYVTWTIPGFSRLSRESGYAPESPKFPFSDGRYRLRLVSDWYKVDIKLVNLTDKDTGRHVSYEIGFKSTSGEEFCMYRCGTSTTRYFYIYRSDLDRKRFQCSCDGHLTVFCCIRKREPSNARSPNSGGTETPGSKAPVLPSAAHTKSVGVQTADEGDKEGLPGISKLQSDYKQLLLKGVETDACLVVCDKEFRAHQMILRARSTVFNAMFGHETEERESGRVVIDDLDPDSFGHFLEYLYTGGIGAGLSDDNTFGLYEAADKYDVPTLKAECVVHMRKNLSVDSFCDFLVVALRHPEEELLPQAVTFFKENMPRIIVTVKWQQFVIDNGTSANELLIKAVVPPGQ